MENSNNSNNASNVNQSGSRYVYTAPRAPSYCRKRRLSFGESASLPNRKRIHALPAAEVVKPIHDWWKGILKQDSGCEKGICYYCRKGKVFAGCDRCRNGLCELCTRSCDICKVASCTYCLIGKYEKGIEQAVCDECCEGNGEGRVHVTEMETKEVGELDDGEMMVLG